MDDMVGFDIGEEFAENMFVYQKALVSIFDGDVSTLRGLLDENPQLAGPIISNWECKKRSIKTLLHAAAHANKEEIVELLVSYGADVNAVVDFTLDTPLHYAADVSGIEAVTKLIALGADVNMPDKFGNTPFVHVTHLGREKLFYALMQGNPTLSTLRRLERDIEKKSENFLWNKDRAARMLEVVRARIQELFTEPSVPTETIPEI